MSGCSQSQLLWVIQLLTKPNQRLRHAGAAFLHTPLKPLPLTVNHPRCSTLANNQGWNLVTSSLEDGSGYEALSPTSATALSTAETVRSARAALWQ